MQKWRTTHSVSKKTDQISVRLSPETMAVLREIDQRHGLIPTELTRRLIECAAEFYRKHGWFSFPVDIYPHSLGQLDQSMVAEKPPEEPPKKKR